MLTNTLLLYVTQEAWAKARARFSATRTPEHGDITAPHWLAEADRRQEDQEDRRRGFRRWPERTRH